MNDRVTKKVLALIVTVLLMLSTMSQYAIPTFAEEAKTDITDKVTINSITSPNAEIKDSTNVNDFSTSVKNGADVDYKIDLTVNKGTPILSGDYIELPVTADHGQLYESTGLSVYDSEDGSLLGEATITNNKILIKFTKKDNAKTAVKMIISTTMRGVSSLTKNLNIFLENPVTESEVEKINNFLNEKIANSQYFTLSDLKDFFTNTNLFSQSDFQGNGISDEGKLFFEGGTNLIENNTSDVMNIINRVKLFNNPNDLRNVFSQFLQMEEFKDGEVNVIFGEDLKIAGLEDFSFVFSVYTLNNARGIIGVIGPKRMEYSKTVGLVEYVAEEVNQLLNQKNKQ